MSTEREVHIGDRPLGQWRALGYRRRETVVCFSCWRGIDAPVGTKVPLPARGRIGGPVRPQFANLAGTAPPGGHIRETVRHVNAKYRLGRWAPALSNVARGSASSVLFLRLVSHLGPVWCAAESAREVLRNAPDARG
ncbi:hypothetical protein [Streptomyces lydicus]|uniref:hypothetical protein n=1 Tax=Streptomyces lydicus TaxID=47763 RepID=UPI002870835F|nr:hypothetical protein [Streptomyces lydicus]